MAKPVLVRPQAAPRLKPTVPAKPALVKPGGKSKAPAPDDGTLEDDPLGVVYTGDAEVDAAAELAALEEAFQGQRKASMKTADKNFNRLMKDENSVEFFFGVVFLNQEDRDKFLAAVSKAHRISLVDGVEWLDGYDLAAAVGIPVERPPKRERRYKLRSQFSDLAEE